jgi:hypothetical protein
LCRRSCFLLLEVLQKGFLEVEGEEKEMERCAGKNGERGLPVAEKLVTGDLEKGGRRGLALPLPMVEVLSFRRGVVEGNLDLVIRVEFGILGRLEVDDRLVGTHNGIS